MRPSPFTRSRSRLARRMAAMLALSALIGAAGALSASDAQARGRGGRVHIGMGHGGGGIGHGGHGMHGAGNFARGRGDDPQTKAASEELDRLLRKIPSICTRC